MNTFEKFEQERDNIALNTLLGVTPDFTELRKIARDLQPHLEYDLKIDQDDATFWNACNKLTRELAKKS